MSASASLFGTQAIAGSAGAGGLNLTSNAVFGYVIGPLSPYLPLASSRMKSNGQAQKAGGSTAALLTYTNISNQWWSDIPNATGADFEVYFDTVTNEPGNSSAATWFGNTRDSWIALSSDRTWTLQKNVASFGEIIWPVLITIREISNPTNTTGPITWTHSVIYDA